MREILKQCMLFDKKINLLFSTLNIRTFFTKGSARSASVKRNIAVSFVLKCISILISLQVVPLTINYINPTKYGLWMTLSSIIVWLSYFDFGFAHGFRNRFSEARANGNTLLAREYVSTTYVVLFILFGGVFLFTMIINHFLDWSNILNVDVMYSSELHTVFQILAFFFCINIVGSIFTIMLTADQKPAWAALIQTGGQVLAFIGIYILTLFVPGNLSLLALVFLGIPCVMLIVTSIVLFRWGRYKIVSPAFRFVRFSLIKNVLGLGGQFFFIMLSMLFIFQFINIIISRIEGPNSVTQYNIAYKYFSVLNMFAIIILTPFWSAFTDAYVKRDLNWMKSMVKKLEWMWLLCIPVLTIMVVCSDFLYKYWIGDAVSIPLSLSICMAFYILFQTAGNIYMYLINGTSRVRLQLIVYLSIALIAIPLMQLCCRLYGVEGILIVPTLTFGLQALIGKIQIAKIVNNTAKGIWLK